MKVRLVGFTQPSEDFSDSFKDAKDLVAFCARVSNPSNQYNTDTADKLIRYLIKHQHWSPMELASVTIEIETTRDIARQFLRHRSFSFQEFSQRYADPTKDLDFEVREARLQDDNNRQNSLELDIANLEHRELNKLWREKQGEIIRLVKDTYLWAVSNGIAKEQARAILPEGNTASRMYVNGTIRSWIHYIQVRTDVATQKEHRELALEIAKIIHKVFPFDVE